MKTIIKLLIFALLCLLVYNYFYGDEQERETSSQVVDHAKQLGLSLWEMVLTEKDRFSDGKHHEIMENIGSTIGFIQENRVAMNISDDQIEDLEKHKGELDSLLLNHSKEVDGEKRLPDEAKEKLGHLLEKLESLINQE